MLSPQHMKTRKAVLYVLKQEGICLHNRISCAIIELVIGVEIEFCPKCNIVCQ